MIDLTEEQRAALAGGDRVVRDPGAGETYVLVRRDVFDRVTRALEDLDAARADYDDSPWTDEEMDRLAEEAGEMLDRYRP